MHPVRHGCAEADNQSPDQERRCFRHYRRRIDFLFDELNQILQQFLGIWNVIFVFHKIDVEDRRQRSKRGVGQCPDAERQPGSICAVRRDELPCPRTVGSHPARCSICNL